MILMPDGSVAYSATDLTAASTCEWALMRKLDSRLGRGVVVPDDTDDMLERAARLGDKHERDTLEALKASKHVIELERPGRGESIADAVATTVAALRSGADVVFQAAFFDGRFLGYADFIQRSGTTDAGEPIYEVYDTKLARRAKITALLQLAAYSEQLHELGIPTGDEVHLILGTGETSTHSLGDILPVYRKRRARLQQIIDGRVADPEVTPWGDPRYAACGRCGACVEQVEATRDLLLVAGMRLGQRDVLRDVGVTTIDQLAMLDAAPDGLADATFRRVRAQAQVQLEAAAGTLPWRIANARALGALPEPDDGDLFFDFEGDPLYQEGAAWGLDYLWGAVDVAGEFHAFWAHDLAEEKRALIDFLAWVGERRQQHPGLHIYHYAPYERTHLLTIAARHGVGEEEVAALLRDHVLVDLYPIVKRAVVVGSPSYSLKKLEPLYMTEARSGVDNAADSVSEYVRWREARDSGDPGAHAIIRDIADYNEYDCHSTRGLRDWLLARARENEVSPALPDDETLDAVQVDPDPLYGELQSFIAGVPALERTTDETAIALAAAAIDYHRRESNTFWWDHFERLRADLDDWADTRDVLVIDEVRVVTGWTQPARGNPYRELEITGTAAAGSSFGGNPFLVYEPPVPPSLDRVEPGARWAHDRAQLTEFDGETFRVTERVRTDAPTYDELPIAFAPSAPPRAGVLVSAIAEWGGRVRDAWPAPLEDAALDILRRVPPRGPRLEHDRSNELGGHIGAIRDAVLALDRSYIAVQGPPGTGKTYTGSRVIADLVQRHGWRIGVVSQSHAAVENMLDAIIAAGVPAGKVGKKPKEPGGHAWTELTSGEVPRFAQREGVVLGGTAWTFATANSVPRAHLDLLVIDEAGQFSLANTIAASAGARRILLLGDPQQLPQVSQGLHPEPVDVSALGWLSDGHDVLPDDLGFFLDTSWRMHPAVCEPVSRLSYEGRLTSHDSVRHLEGIVPGLHPVPIGHEGNATASQEEADAVVALVGSHLGRAWTDEHGRRPLEQRDIIVVAPYNAHVELIRETLGEAGYTEVPVGTVDRFQGQEAAVAIVSLAASSAAEVPRGLDFLLLANRLNVAISRAQWAAYLVYSPALTETLPHSVPGLARLSAFIGLVETA